MTLDPPRVEPLSGRHLVFRVARAGAGLVVKQAVDDEARRALKAEASMYRYLETSGDERPPIPRLLDEDAGRGVIIVQDFPNHRPLSTVTSAVAAWAAIGTAIASLHRVPPPEGPSSPPGIVFLDRPDPSLLRRAGPRRLRLVAHVQKDPRWRRGLARLRADWRSTVVAHGDLRLENVLVGAGRAGLDVRVVDWELAGGGDAAADVGWIVGSLLAHALRPAAKLSTATASAAGGLWERYCLEHGWVDSGPHGRRAVRWSAARLLEAAYEDPGEATSLGRFASRCLATGGSMLEDPSTWSRRLLGQLAA